MTEENKMSEEIKKDTTADLNEHLSDIKEEMKKDNKRDAVKDNVRTIAAVIMAASAAVIALAVVLLINNINNKINAIYVKADSAITTLNEVANDIHSADLVGMADQLKALTENAADGVSTTMEKIDSIDIEHLNDTIERLDETTQAFQATVEALNNPFGH